jgi:hypothetical protein
LPRIYLRKMLGPFVNGAREVLSNLIKIKNSEKYMSGRDSFTRQKIVYLNQVTH